MNNYIASAPGSIMLFGEHAVLHGEPALVCAIDKRVTVCLQPRQDEEIHLYSELNGKQILQLIDIKENSFYMFSGWRFVLASITLYAKQISCGFDLQITSDYNEPIGLGSSAAITVAVLKVLSLWLDDKSNSKEELLRQAVQVIRQVQGIGSGADAAASVYGGVVFYQIESLQATKLNIAYPLTLIYSGTKVPTPQVIEQVTALEKRHPQLVADLYVEIGVCTNAAKQAWEKADWHMVGELMNIHQGLQDALGVNNQALSEIIFALRSDKNILGAKISGSGLGDCVVGLGNADRNNGKLASFNPNYTNIPIKITSEGVDFKSSH